MDKRIIDKIRHDGSKPSDLVLHLLPAVLVQDVIVHQGHNKLVPAAVYVLQPGRDRVSRCVKHVIIVTIVL